MKNRILFFVLMLSTCTVFGQETPFFETSVLLTGYAYDDEQNHRLDEVQINVYHNEVLLSNFTETGMNGTFKIKLPEPGNYRLDLIRPAYERQSVQLSIEGRQELTVALPMKRLEGYEFIGLIKKLLPREDELGPEITDTRIEIYNHTTGDLDLDIMTHPKSQFNFNFERGNRYTVLLRKKDFFAKRFDVVVNTEGCILCFEGLGLQFMPDILDELTREQKKGAIEGYVMMRPIEVNEAIRLDNIYYDFDKWNIRRDARPALDKLVQTMRATPIIIELGSHTDSRGTAEYNADLSQKRAQSAVDYIVSKGIDPIRISAKGYGESVPVNECVDGVKCNESAYQQNRRTEFKVTRIMTGSSFDNKTLKEIIDIERTVKRRFVEVLGVE